MKKITALLLVAVMLISMCLASCGDDTPTPGPGPTPGPVDSGNNGGSDTTANNSGTNPPAGDKEYVPDETASFGGWFGIASAGGQVYFDNVKGVGTVGKIDLFNYTFDEEGANLDKFTAASGDIADWSIVDEPVIETEDEAEEADEEAAEEATANKVLATSKEGLLTFGGANWNRAQLTAKVMIAEGAGGVEFYFGYKDDKNYYVVNIGDGDNTSVNVTSVTAGKATVDTFDLPYKITPDEWFNVSVVLNPKTVTVYVAGQQLFEAYKEVDPANVYKGGIGFGTWSTSYSIDNIKVTKYETGEVMYENDFTNTDLSGWQTYVAADGAWASVDTWDADWVVAADTAEGSEHGNIFQCVSTSITGGGMMLTESLNNPDWTNYVFEFDARKDGGAEGFMPYFAASDMADPSKADYVRWNQGGWGNTQTCFQSCTEGSLSNFTQTADVYTTGEWYHVTIYVVGNQLVGLVNGSVVSMYVK